MQHKIKAGKYRHYKGNLYQVEGLAKHSETEEMMVVYRPLYGEQALWVRPLTMFIEDVEVDGSMQPRFAFTDKAE
ncbi:DUF1653 domain-containing protein [Psychromonas sp.]|uniref:DUF1653 domain-containing protein n=1 Tax=Psychromonas sp. TaxID=1884585 RepID=UPI0039E3830A